LHELGYRLGIPNLFAKNEGANPTRTQKDRPAVAVTEDALRMGFPGIVIASCGNFGTAVARAARLRGLPCTVFIPHSAEGRRVCEITAEGAVVRREGRHYEDSVVASMAFAADEGLYDANPGGRSSPLQRSAYGAIASEIVAQLGEVPAYVSVAVSNGTTLAGLYEGFLALDRAGGVSRLPSLLAGSSLGQNAIVSSWIDGGGYRNLPESVIRETPINEPIASYIAYDGDVALTAIRHTGGRAGWYSDDTLAQLAAAIVSTSGIPVTPASTAAIAVLQEAAASHPLTGVAVAVLTGATQTGVG
jgi:threonine synthase